MVTARICTALSLVAVTLALGTGCDAPGFSKKVKSPSELAQEPVGQASTTSADVAAIKGIPDPSTTQSPAVFTPGLSISDAIARACGIASTAGKTVPSFDYDSAALADSDRSMLADVARCLTEGALKGRTVTLIGRTDARGEPEYNMGLGDSRASTVHRYLVDLGVGRDRMRPTSRGEIDATGTNDEGYAKDRRVDIELAL